jgi:inosine-uridine nucleoside N-ribohydrolase
MKPKLIIDTDPGHDDVLALLLLIKSGLFDIKAITTVAGNSTIENVTKNAAYTLDLVRRRDIPLFSGQPKPLKRDLLLAVVHGDSGLDGVDTSKTNFTLTGNASQRITELIKKNPNEITLIALGPLTNIARSFEQNPHLPSLLKQIVIMGGAINVQGNKNRVGEFNMVVDPEAADIVFRAYVPKVLVPIDVCNDFPIPLENFQELQGSSLYVQIMSMMQKFIEGIEKDEGTKGALVYDAIAAYYLLNPDAFTLELMDIVIETKGEHTFGMTVAEKRKNKSVNPNLEVVIRMDKTAFIKDFFSTLIK